MRAITLSLLVLLFLIATTCASDITSFTDAKCTRSWRALDTVNGYPDGLCKPLNVTKGQSFQIQELDQGCAVTLYGANAGPLPCSSEMKIVGHLATCYDSSWVYYSIDGCLPPTSSSTRVTSMKPTATGPSATKSASATPEPKVHTGVIVGSTVAGVSCVILGLAGMLLVLRRRRKLKSSKPSKPRHELSEDRALAESDAAAEKRHPKELWGDHAAVEIGRNSRFEGMMRDARPVRGVNPLIQVHYVP
ncbi:hypothetical protein BU25DRAFT_459262 [Macroventuria anomochaeta]|uniref:Uncharacterized protein n=1 Tax=Macroventuria anomochaeta TaxID=301207 RepID=A0ACB6RYR0_9PLEO|nr:uncharacterized protein BU25DRAFT_459262 [Macroventuria anomochaeta]KAF2626560.1 hypothetical protein BU25DRAFT_459262 [Macroventuria anomochaeta]